MSKKKLPNALNTLLNQIRKKQFIDEKLPFSTRGTLVSQKFPESSSRLKIQLLSIST